MKKATKAKMAKLVARIDEAGEVLKIGALASSAMPLTSYIDKLVIRGGPAALIHDNVSWAQRRRGGSRYHAWDNFVEHLRVRAASTNPTLHYLTFPRHPKTSSYLVALHIYQIT